MSRRELEKWEERRGSEHEEQPTDNTAVIWHWAIWVAVFAYSVLGGRSCGS